MSHIVTVLTVTDIVVTIICLVLYMRENVYRGFTATITDMLTNMISGLPIAAIVFTVTAIMNAVLDPFNVAGYIVALLLMYLVMTVLAIREL